MKEKKIATEPVVLQEEMWSFDNDGLVEFTAEFGPILRDGDYAILPIVFDSAGSEEIQLDRAIYNEGFVAEDARSGHDIRLIDANNRTVSHMAVVNYESIAGNDMTRSPFIDLAETDYPTVSDVSEMEERRADDSRYPLGVPTLKEIAESELPSNRFESLQDDLENHITTRVMPLESYRENAETTISQIDEVERSTLVLSSDVLFEFDKSDLTATADGELESAIRELAGVEAGKLEMVGHTDNKASEEYNQKLSEERAQSVHNRLENHSENQLLRMKQTEDGHKIDV
ncbi:OmpA family protein [Enterococcus olivae]